MNMDVNESEELTVFLFSFSAFHRSLASSKALDTVKVTAWACKIKYMY